MKGFSKLTKEQKINFLIDKHFNNDINSKKILIQYFNNDKDLQNLHDEISENTISNFYLPFGVAPGFLINGKEYTIPMVTEESSVVAAAANSAKFWKERGGFKTKILGTDKTGQVHFIFNGKKEDLLQKFYQIKEHLLKDTESITQNMRKRGGGIKTISLIDSFINEIDNYYQLKVTFETKDSMGANFINSCLERIGETLERELKVEIIMCILSNYTPNCLVRAEVESPLDKMDIEGMEGEVFCKRFCTAIKIAEIDIFRATTHNKGIMNGIDSLVLATGNDFRAVEASAHAYASKDGKYSSLSHCEIENGIFRFWIEIPLSLGTVGGLTSLHPLSKFSLQMLGNPKAEELMEIMAVLGLAQNFSAIKALITTGIQKGHMKMHLSNILNQLGASKEEKDIMTEKFRNKVISVAEVSKELENIKEI